jgi:hypothetical protein
MNPLKLTCMPSVAGVDVSPAARAAALLVREVAKWRAMWSGLNRGHSHSTFASGLNGGLTAFFQEHLHRYQKRKCRFKSSAPSAPPSRSLTLRFNSPLTKFIP